MSKERLSLVECAQCGHPKDAHKWEKHALRRPCSIDDCPCDDFDAANLRSVDDD